MLEVGERNDDWGSTRTDRRYLVLVQRGLPALQQAQRSATSQVHNSRTSPDCTECGSALSDRDCDTTTLQGLGRRRPDALDNVVSTLTDVGPWPIRRSFI
jgi:hypothetical protein